MGIPGTALLVSLHHSYEYSAALTIFDISAKFSIAQPVFSFEEVEGCNFNLLFQRTQMMLQAQDSET